MPAGALPALNRFRYRRLIDRLILANHDSQGTSLLLLIQADMLPAASKTAALQQNACNNILAGAYPLVNDDVRRPCFLSPFRSKKCWNGEKVAFHDKKVASHAFGRFWVPIDARIGARKRQAGKRMKGGDEESERGNRCFQIQADARSQLVTEKE